MIRDGIDGSLVHPSLSLCSLTSCVINWCLLGVFSDSNEAQDPVNEVMKGGLYLHCGRIFQMLTTQVIVV
jgi:hypothetical protein